MRRDLGDFQTPPLLVTQVFEVLARLGIRWSRVLEPTCGRGNFLAASLKHEPRPRELQGIEAQPAYVEEARAACSQAGEGTVRLLEADLFKLDLARDLTWTDTGPLLVVGNPPWVTASELGRLGSDNGPVRANLKQVRGIDARTGGSNFDLAEAVWIKLVRELADLSPTIALLCKATVARNLLKFAQAENWPLLSGSFHRIDSRVWFGASVEAGLLRVTLGKGTPAYAIDFYPRLDADRPSKRLGIVDGMAVADLDAFQRDCHLFGRSTRVWRQGIKHDVASLLELTRDGQVWRNGLNDIVEIEPDRIFPMLKAADLARVAPSPERGLIVLQSGLNDDPAHWAESAPLLWRYLSAHADRFAARKSSIYRNRACFSIFGVGPYTFGLHKVAVSGLHTSARFRAIGPVGGRPVVFDDTSYFLPCSSLEEAEALAEGLNGREAQALIQALFFPGSKRPVTKGLLQRIDLSRLPTTSVSSTEV